LPARNKYIRCRRCGGKAPAALMVCPHCGRELQPAPPRLLTWGAPLILILLFASVLLTQLNGGPVAWTQRQAARVATLIDSLGARLQPDITITTIPVSDADEDQLVSQPAPAVMQAVAIAETPTGEVTEATVAPTTVAAATTTAALPAATEATPTVLPPTVSPPTATPLLTATTPPTALPTASPTASLPTSTATSRATNSITPTGRETTTTAITTSAITTSAITATSTITAEALTAASALALALPTPTPTNAVPTPTPNVYRIRTGDTLFELALDNDISLEALLTANGLTEDDVYTIQPGDDIIIPDPNAPTEPTATATSTPTLAPEGVTYTVRAGDTLMEIGLRFGVNIQRVLDANGLTLTQARSLRPGQELIIPGDATAATTITPVPTTPAPTSTPPTPTPGAGIRLDAPTLRSPENGTSVQCGAGEQLTWDPVSFIRATDLYVVHFGYVNGRDASGAEQVVWVLAQPRPSNVTLWQLDDSLCGLAPFDYGRQWRWYVDVAEKAADDTLIPVSPPSPTWGFAWQ